MAEGSSLGVRMELLQTATNLQAAAQAWHQDASLACNEEADPFAIEQVSYPSFNGI